MFLHVIVFTVALLTTKGSITELTDFSNLDFEDHSLIIYSLTNKWIKWSDGCRPNVGSDRHVRALRHLSGLGHNPESTTRRLFAARIRDYLSWKNRRKLERHELPMRRMMHPILHNLSENRRNYKLLRQIQFPDYKDYGSNAGSGSSEEFLYDNSLYSGNMITTSKTPYVNIYNTKFQEVTKNDILDGWMMTKESNSAYGTQNPLDSYKLREEIRRKYVFKSYLLALEAFERKFYLKTFEILSRNSPAGRQDNGISFVQSGLFMNLLLLSLSTTTDADTTMEINNCIGFNLTETDKTKLIEEILTILPNSTDGLRWRWSSRLVLGFSQDVSEEFRHGVALAMRLRFNKFNGTESPEVMATSLNNMVEQDSAGAMREAFEENELSEGMRAVSLTTLYLRATWRSAPTVLNGSRPFRDGSRSPPPNVRMIRINDVMGYANLNDWKFQAIEIPYTTPGLSLLMLVPHETSLRNLTQLLASTSLDQITSQLVTMRVAVTMPIYTLRMTLLLPSKLQAMGVNRLFNWTSTENGKLRLSHGVQRLMFWAEAGRNAFKDDGLEWNEMPQMKVLVDRPYIFFVRWKNLTIMNGNFVL